MTPSSSQPTPPPRGSARALVAVGAGVAAALGVGLGLWARPAAEPVSTPEVAAADAAPPAEALQIVVDDGPAPIGAPMQVLPPSAPPPAPRRALHSGVMKVAEQVEAPQPLPVVALAPLAPAAQPVGPARPSPPARRPPPDKSPTRPASAKPKPPLARAKPAVVAKAAVKPTRKAKAAATRVAKARIAPKASVQPKPVRVAKAPAAKKAIRAAPVKSAAKPRSTSKGKPPLAPAVQAKAPRKPILHGEGPRRVASADRCGQADRAEALVCGDSRLAARERQLRRAYQAAEAAGVPEAALRRQQGRWLAARAAAAREAPWAVEDVYVARISELKSLAADAREN